MRVIDIVGVAGSIISIFGAIWSAYNVGAIKKAKKEIISRFRIVRYSELTSTSKGVLIQIRKIANKKSIPPGVNFHEIIDSLNVYYENLNGIKNDIEEDGFHDLQIHMDTIRNDINIASQIDRKQTKEIIEIYTTIYYRILNIDSEISRYNKKNLEK